MSAFLKIGDIKGEATDQDHKDWVLLESLSSSIMRSIPEGAKDQQRTKGETTLGDIVVVRELDKSTPKLAEASAAGHFFPEAEFHLCTTVKGKEEPYYKVKLGNVILTSYSFHGNSSGSPIPTEELTLNYESIEWVYEVVDPRTGDRKGTVPGKYEPGTGKAG